MTNYLTSGVGNVLPSYDVLGVREALNESMGKLYLSSGLELMATDINPHVSAQHEHSEHATSVRHPLRAGTPVHRL